MIRRAVVSLILCLYLGIQDGHLTLFDNKGNEYIFPYRAELYTDLDRTLLRKGIPLSDQKKLTAALEDYFS